MPVLRRLLHVLFWLGLAVYLGGMLALGTIAAPAIFQTARAEKVATPLAPPTVRQPDYLGGQTFGLILDRFALLEAACLVAIALGIEGRWHRNASRWPRLTLIALVLILTLLWAYGYAVQTPAVLRARVAWYSAAGSPATQPASRIADLKADFDHLHQHAEAVGHAKVYVLLALLITAAWTSTPPAPAKPNHPALPTP